MDLSPYLESVRHGVTDAAALADDHTRHVADRLGTAIDSATRLALIQVLADAAGVISAELAPASVQVRMSGQDPELVVDVPPSAAEPTLLLPPEEQPGPPETDGDEPLSRISLRLPNSVKAKVDEVADREGVSTNAWLLRAVLDALGDRRRSDQGAGATTPPAGGVFGPNGPFGPYGIFGAGGPFGPARPDRPRDRGDRDRGDRDRDRPGGVQGWVR